MLLFKFVIGSVLSRSLVLLVERGLDLEPDTKGNKEQESRSRLAYATLEALTLHICAHNWASKAVDEHADDPRKFRSLCLNYDKALFACISF